MDQRIQVATTADTMIPLLRELLKTNLFVKGRIAKAVFRDSVKTGTLDPIAALAVLYVNDAPVAWTVRTTEDWRTGYDDTQPRTTNEIWWRYTAPEFRQRGFCTLLKSALTTN